MVRRSKEEAERTRELLLDAAELVFVDKGVAATSLNTIAIAAGVTRGAVYWHFKNKDDLFNAMHARVKLPMDEMFQQLLGDVPPLDAIQQVCIASLKRLGENERTRRVYTILLHKCEQSDPGKNDRLHQTREECISKITSIFTSAQEAGHLAPNVDIRTTAIALHAYMYGLYSDYLSNSEMYDIVTHAPMMVKIFFDGLQLRK
jgi:AcrR family transcriptional regulator